jgi:hypothetical protein
MLEPPSQSLAADDPQLGVVGVAAWGFRRLAIHGRHISQGLVRPLIVAVLDGVGYQMVSKRRAPRLWSRSINERSTIVHRGPCESRRPPFERLHQSADIRPHDHLIAVDLNHFFRLLPHRRQVLTNHV